MIVQMPTKGVHTLYARLGDWFAWVSLLSLAVLVLMAITRRSTSTY
jgi:apolipoprotein N-acyltransferase